MNRLEFINELGAALSVLPPEEVKKALDYYVESIDDRMEDGMTEEAAIESLGPIPELAEKILSEQEPEKQPEPEPDPFQPPKAPEPPVQFIVSEAQTPPPSPAPKKRRIPGWAIVLLIVGSPLWLTLGAAGLIVVLALEISAWAVLVSLLITSGALILGGIVGAPMSFFGSVYPNTMAVRVLCCGLSLFSAGLGFLLLPASLFLLRGFAKCHGTLFRMLTDRKEASK